MRDYGQLREGGDRIGRIDGRLFVHGQVLSNLDALLAVTKQEGEHGAEGYGHFIERAARDPLARRVKIADLEDNRDVTRLESIGPKDTGRINRNLAALHRLRALEAEVIA
jgi:hypothetical protein